MYINLMLLVAGIMLLFLLFIVVSDEDFNSLKTSVRIAVKAIQQNSA